MKNHDSLSREIVQAVEIIEKVVSYYSQERGYAFFRSDTFREILRVNLGKDRLSKRQFFKYLDFAEKQEVIKRHRIGKYTTYWTLQNYKYYIDILLKFPFNPKKRSKLNNKLYVNNKCESKIINISCESAPIMRQSAPIIGPKCTNLLSCHRIYKNKKEKVVYTNETSKVRQFGTKSPPSFSTNNKFKSENLIDMESMTIDEELALHNNFDLLLSKKKVDDVIVRSKEMKVRQRQQGKVNHPCYQKSAYQYALEWLTNDMKEKQDKKQIKESHEIIQEPKVKLSEHQSSKVQTLVGCGVSEEEALKFKNIPDPFFSKAISNAIMKQQNFTLKHHKFLYLFEQELGKMNIMVSYEIKIHDTEENRLILGDKFNKTSKFGSYFSLPID